MTTLGKNNKKRSKGQFALLRSRRFGPFFGVQVAGAFNDNFFKSALAMLLVFQTASPGNHFSWFVVNLASGLLIAPFVLFSGLAGQFADKLEKSRLIRIIKASEIAIMGLGFAALICQSIVLQFAVLFAMGTQSAFFGPLKYSLLPQHLKPEEIVDGNALAEMGTFTAILMGSLAASALVVFKAGTWLAGLITVFVAVAGWLFSTKIPFAESAEPSLRLKWRPIAGFKESMGRARKDPAVFYAILGLAWFWFMGAAYVIQLPVYVSKAMHANAAVAGLLLAAFTLGVGGGALLCARFSKKGVEPGLAPIGSLLMGLAGCHLAGIGFTAQKLTLLQFIKIPGSAMLLVDLVLTGIGGGLFAVPLYALIQLRAPRHICSRIIAAGNVLNALAMLLSAVIAIFLLSFCGLEVRRFYGLLAVISLVVTVIASYKTVLHLLRLSVWALIKVLYRIRCNGLEAIPGKGAAVLVCNHVSYLDALIIAGSCSRPIRFIMHISYYKIPGFKWFFNLARVIPICSGRRNRKILAAAFDEIAGALEQGGLVCIFPEGRLTRTGDIGPFLQGIEKIVERTPVPVIPLALNGLWGSMFSLKTHTWLRLPRCLRPIIKLSATEAVPPKFVSAGKLKKIVSELKASAS